MDSEQAEIQAEAVAIVNNAKEEKRRICAVGTTVMRTLESANCMITNFHTPKSTLLMMVSAFAGHDLMKKAYDEAVKEKYKFYSYGDAMLII